jgi:hypothetical protein
MLSAVTLAEEGGSRTGAEALVEQVNLFIEDGAERGDELLAALASRGGPDRYVPETGKLYIDDQVQAQLRPMQLSDGTWSVGATAVCGAPAEAPPAPTPKPTSTGTAQNG